MTNLEFNALIKGELIHHDSYRHCYKGKTIVLENWTFEEIILDNNEICIYDLHFIKTEFTNSINIETGTFGDIVFSGVIFKNNADFYVRKASINNLFFRNKSELNSLNVYGSIFGKVLFFNAILNSVFITERANFNTIDFMQATVSRGIMVWNGKFGVFAVSGNHRSGINSISEIYFLDAEVEKLNLSSAASIVRVAICRGIYKSIVISNSELKEFITIRTNDKFEPSLTIDLIELKNFGKLSFTLADIFIGSLVFNKYYASKESAFNIINVKINHLKFEKYVNFGEFIFSGLIMDSEGELIIKDSDLGKLSFLNSDIKSLK